MSKSFGGGKASISGLVVRDPVFQAAYGTDATALLQSSTYNGFGEECATALEAVAIAVEEDFPGRARHIHDVLNPGLRALKAKHPGAIREVRGQGGFNGIVLESPFELIEKALEKMPFLLRDRRYFINKIAAAAVVDEMYRDGILTTMVENGDLVTFAALPSLVVADAELHTFLGALDSVLAKGLTRVSAEFVGSKLMMMLKAPHEFASAGPVRAACRPRLGDAPLGAVPGRGPAHGRRSAGAAGRLRRTRPVDCAARARLLLYRQHTQCRQCGARHARACRITAFDPSSGLITVECGVSMAAILDRALPSAGCWVACPAALG